MGLRAAVIMGLVLAVAGCQSLKQSRDPGHMDQARFKELWSLYTHCQTATDPEVMILDAALLNRAAQPSTERIPLLLKPVERFIEPNPSRIAADPRAMAAECTLRAGEAAATMGWNDVAMNLYRSMSSRFPEPSYAYYVSKAQSRLTEVMESEIAKTLQHPNGRLARE